MISLSVIGLAIFGAVFWFVPTEGVAALYGASYGWNPVYVAALCTAGQLITHLALYLSGHKIIEGWKWLGDKIHAARDRWSAHMERNYLVVTGVAGITGVPPLVAMSTLASGFGVSLWHLVMVFVPTRMIRFTAFAILGERLRHLIPTL